MLLQPALTDIAAICQVVKSIAEMLSQLESWVDEIPLDTRAQRFVNRAFRDWGARLQEVCMSASCTTFID